MKWLRMIRLLLFAVVLAAPGLLFTPAWGQAAGSEIVSPPVEKRWGKDMALANDPPVVEGYTVFAVTAGDKPGVAAFELANGRSKWQYSLNKRSGSAPLPRITVQNGVVYVSDGDRVYAIRDKGTGPELLWYAAVKQVEEPPVVSNAAVYVTEKDGTLVSLNRATGSRMWTDVKITASRVTAADGKVFVTAGRTLSAYEEQRYAPALSWTVTMNGEAEQGTGLTRPVYQDGMLFVGLGSKVYGVDAGTGDVSWEAKVPAAVKSDPVAGQGLVFVQTANEATVALDVKTGRIVWQLGERADGPPVVSGNTLYMPAAPLVKAVDARTGKVLDSVQVGNANNQKGIRLAAGNRFLAANAGGTELTVLLSRERNIKIYIDGELMGDKYASYDRLPVIVQGRVLAPIRPLMEALGAKVEWNPSTQTVTVDKEGRQLVVTIGKRDAKVNGKSLLLDVPPQVMDGRTMVPIRFVSEYLDTSVHWDGVTRSVFIYRTKVYPGQKLFIDGREVPGGITLYYHGYYRVLLGDAKPLFDHLGGTIRVDRPFAQATVTVGHENLVFGPQKFVTVNGRKISVHGPFFMPEEPSREGRFFLDLDFFHKAYGWTYRWNRDEATLHIWTQPEA